MNDERPTHLDLFSGIGGFALAAQRAGFRTVCFVEIDGYCRKVLAKNFLRQSNGSGWQEGQQTTKTVGHGHPVISTDCPTRIHSNIFDFDGTAYRGCDLITGGFPCQPFSVAGKRRGAADDRALWPEMFRVITQARPAWVLGENVPGIIPMELDNVLSDLEGIGYATRPFVIPACAVDARHRRDRLWIIAHSTERESGGLQQRGIRPDAGNGSNGRAETTWWLPEPAVGRVAHGVLHRVDRLKGLGNAIVPQVAYEILREIRELI